MSIREVAALAGVSVGTVSNVLNQPDKVSEATASRVREAIHTLGFVRNDAARQLRAGQSRSVGMVVLDASNPFFMDVARGAEARAIEDGFAVLLGNSDEDATREEAYLALFEEQRVAGLLITPVGDAHARLERLRERGIPTVLVDRQAETAGFSSVAVDDVAGGQLAARHLVDAGRGRIAFVGGPLGIRQVSDRLQGARRALAQHPDVAFEVVETESLTVAQGRAVGEAILARAKGARPDAIFAANDLIAVGLLQGLMMQGDIRVPHDIALIGYDDIAFASSSIVPLSSVRQPSELIGSTAVDLLLREAHPTGDVAHEHIVFQPELVARASTSGD